MTSKTRALLSIAVVLVASLGLVWWRHAAHAGSPTSVAPSTSKPQSTIGTLESGYGNWDSDFTRSDASGRVVANGLPAGRVRVVVGWKDGARADISEHDGAFSLANPFGFLVFEHELVPKKRATMSRVLWGGCSA